VTFCVFTALKLALFFGFRAQFGIVACKQPAHMGCEAQLA